MRLKNPLVLLGLLGGFALVSACSSSDSTSDAAFGGDTPGSGAPGLGSDGGASADGSLVEPPEQKAESSYQSPVATGKYVWVANPTSGRVAYINATTLEVHTVEAGDGPTYLA
ncbi:MAG: hypothetical protein ABI461_06045, partial [Polyangiaceae bacterium]